MSTSDLYVLLYASLEAIDRVIEFWLSASFAIVVAAFLAAGRLNRKMYILITAGYLLVSINMFTRYWIHASRFVYARDQLIEFGEPYNIALSITAIISQYIIFALGTFGTIYFVWHTYKGENDQKKNE